VVVSARGPEGRTGVSRATWRVRARPKPKKVQRPKKPRRERRPLVDRIEEDG
jgi:hypothetical protein